MRAKLLILLILGGWLQPARADEPHTFWGKTVEGWIAVFRDTSSTDVQRRQAVHALGCFGPEAQAAVPDLIEAVRRGQLKDEAVGALVQIGAGDEVTVPVLIQQLLGRWWQLPFGQNSLIHVGAPAVPALLEILNGPNQDVRGCVAATLGRIGPPARAAVPSLIRAIEQADGRPDREFLIRSAVQALGRIGPDAKATAPLLNRLLDEAGANDVIVVIALDRIGAPPVRKLLDRFLRDPDSDTVTKLALLGPTAREAVPALRAALTDKRFRLRSLAAVALAHIDPSAGESIPVLIQALKRLDAGGLDAAEDLDVGDVPGALAWLGRRARAALPVLIGLVNKEDADSELLKALVQIDPEGTECVPALIEALKREDYESVDVAAQCLGLLGPRAKAAAPALAKTVTRDFPESSLGVNNPPVSAAKALRRIGPQAKSAIPILMGALKLRRIERADFGGGPWCDCSAAEAAAQVLGSFGAEAKAAIPALVEAVQTRETDDANRPVREAAILALGQIGPDARAAIPVLGDLMNESGEKSPYYPDLVIALYQLAPDGKAIAQQGLEKMMINHVDLAMSRAVMDRAVVFGAMGQSSVEGDYLTRLFLEQIDTIIANTYPIGDYGIADLERWFETIGHLGASGRLAVPRLNDFRKNHRNPWVRLWAAEALERIVKPPSAKAD
jgi:HEAT repeat protein